MIMHYYDILNNFRPPKSQKNISKVINEKHRFMSNKCTWAWSSSYSIIVKRHLLVQTCLKWIIKIKALVKPVLNMCMNFWNWGLLCQCNAPLSGLHWFSFSFLPTEREITGKPGRVGSIRKPHSIEVKVFFFVLKWKLVLFP